MAFRAAVPLPPTLAPSNVYVQDTSDFVPGTQVILVFDPNAPSYTLYEASNVLYGKLVGRGTAIEKTQVNGQPAVWLAGSSHLLVLIGADGKPRLESERSVSAQTLDWQVGSLTCRLETNASKEQVDFQRTANT
ncbi:MAG: hypothetical protein M1482_11245 [Chloroflexi bacterium]|nr:hypothetical protein [Chloroflexota bacterium]